MTADYNSSPFENGNGNGHSSNGNGHGNGNGHSNGHGNGNGNGHGSRGAYGNGNGAVGPYPRNGNPGYDISALGGGLQILPLPYYSHQEAAQERDEFDLRQFAQIIRRRAWLIGGVAALVTLCAWGTALTRRPIYQGGFQVLLDTSPDSQAAEQLLTSRQSFDVFEYNTQLFVLKGSALLQPVYQRLQQEYPSFTYGQLVGSLSLDYVKGTKILGVAYRGENPALVKAVLDEVSEAYLTHSLQQQRDALEQGIQFVEGQLPTLRGRVNSLQKNLEEFRKTYNLIDPESRGGQLSGLLNSIEQQQQSTQMELEEVQYLYALLENQIGMDGDRAFASAILSESPHYQNVLKEIETLETKIALESARFQPNSPQIQALEDRVNNLSGLLQTEAQRVLGTSTIPGINDRMTSLPLDLTKQLVTTFNQVQRLQVRRQALAVAEQQVKSEFDLIPSLSRQYTDLQRDLQVATESLNRFLETRETLEIERSQQSIPWQLISEPAASPVPIGPNIPRNLSLGLVAGLVLGVATGLLRDRFDHVFHSVEELKEAVKFPIIATIPYSAELEGFKGIQAQEREPAGNQPSLAQTPAAHHQWRTPLEQTNRSYGYGYGASAFQEAFRLLYSNLRFLGSDTPIRSVVISSALPGDGKSTVSVYTAQAAAAMGQRVLIVDADMRRPKLHTRLGLSNMRGLSNVLANNLNPEEVIQTVDTNLSVITAGQVPPDPTKLLSSNRMKGLIAQFQDTFDLVLYDTPPLLGLADGTLLAPQCDGVILVVGLGKTDRGAVRTVLDNLKVSCVPILGVVANGLTQATTYGGSYYQHYYQGYYHRAPSAKVNQKETVNS